MKYYLLAFSFFFSFFSLSQDQHSLNVEGYVDTYYAYFDDNFQGDFQPYTTTSPRNSQIGLNIAQVSAHYNQEKLRASLGLHYGDIAAATWSTDFNQIQEANVGVRIAKNLWIDAGFFTTHIGTESFLPKNNWTTSTAVATFNEPFYQAGAKLSYQLNDKWSAELWLLNGYNQFVDINDAQSLGLLVNYQATEVTSFTYTNLMGKESLDDAAIRQYRTYHNVYMNTSLNDKWLLTVGADLGTQTNSDLEDGSTAFMYNALISSRYIYKDNFSVSGRFEIFQDPNGFISGLVPNSTSSSSGLEVYGITLSTEYKPTKQSFIRLEARALESMDNRLIFDNTNSSTRFEIMCNLGIVLDKKLSW